MLHGKIFSHIQKVFGISLCVYSFLYFSDILFYLKIYPDYTQHRGIFLAFILTLSFLLFPARKGTPRNNLPWYDIVCILLALAACLYPVLFPELTVMHARLMQMTLLEGFFAWILMVLILEATRRAVGMPMVIVTAFFILYPVICPWLPGAFEGRGYTFQRIAHQMYLGIDFSIFGMVVGIAATIIVAFILFAQVMYAVGAGKFFIDMAFSLFGGTRGGPAKGSVVASGFFGTISGSGAANVATTGAFTIPVMKQAGYKPAVAGAVEAVASNGGHFMPPVMGAIAFIMAEWLGMPYGEVCLHAALPAILYYLGLFFQVDLIAAKENLHGLPRAELPSLRDVLKRGWGFLVPLLVLIYMLIIMRYTPEKSALWAIIAIVLVSQLQKRSRLSWQQWINEVAMGTARVMCLIGAACAASNIILASVGTTGLAQRLTAVLTDIAGGNMLILLILGAVFCYILGTGVGPIAIYVTLALLAAPILVKGGVEPIAAHLFTFMMACTAFITPPVCLNAFIAAPIAGASPMKIGWNAMKLGIVTYIVPFFFCYRPELLLIGSAGGIAWAVFTSVAGVAAIASGIAGYLLKNLSWVERILLIGAGIALIAPGWQINITSLIVLAILVIRQAATQQWVKRQT
ncbi:TRAP transporter permease [Chloroflexota bacterium]